MTNTKLAVDAITRHFGLDPGRVAAVARRLTEAGVIPAGGPRKSPQLDTEHVVSILIGSCLDVPLRAIADAVADYRALVPAGADMTGAPASISRTAGDALDVLAEWARGGDEYLLRRHQIEVVSSWPEIVVTDGKAGARYVRSGELATHWQASGHRRSTTLNGSAFVDCLLELFGEHHAR